MGAPQPAITLRRGYTDCRYGQLHYLECRPAFATAETAPPLVLLHQNPSSSEECRHLALEMGKDRRVIAFDTPGSGMSDWPPGPGPISDLTVAFADGLTHLHLRPETIDVFGYHTGTLLAAEFALSNPYLVGRLVLSGIPWRTDEERKQRLSAARQTPPLTEDGAAVLARFASLWRYVVTDRLPAMPLARAAELFVEKANALDRFWWPYEGVWSYSIPDRFPQIQQPVLVLQPREDLFEQSQAAAQLLPNAQFVELPSLSRDVFDVGIVEISAELRLFLR